MATDTSSPLPLSVWPYDRDAVVTAVREKLSSLVDYEGREACFAQSGLKRTGPSRDENLDSFSSSMVDFVFVQVSQDTTKIAQSLSDTTMELVREREKVADLQKQVSQLVINVGDEVTTTFRPRELRGKKLKVVAVHRDDSPLGDSIDIELPNGETQPIYAAMCRKVLPQKISEVSEE